MTLTLDDCEIEGGKVAAKFDADTAFFATRRGAALLASCDFTQGMLPLIAALWSGGDAVRGPFDE